MNKLIVFLKLGIEPVAYGGKKVFEFLFVSTVCIFLMGAPLFAWGVLDYLELGLVNSIVGAVLSVMYYVCLVYLIICFSVKEGIDSIMIEGSRWKELDRQILKEMHEKEKASAWEGRKKSGRPEMNTQEIEIDLW